MNKVVGIGQDLTETHGVKNRVSADVKEAEALQWWDGCLLLLRKYIILCEPRKMTRQNYLYVSKENVMY